MRLNELLEAIDPKRNKLRHVGRDRGFGLRVQVTAKQRQKIVDTIKRILKIEERYGVNYMSPEYASTFPGEVRVCYEREAPEYDIGQMQGQLAPKLAAGAIKRAISEVLSIDATVTRDKSGMIPEFANGMRYLDFIVSWGGAGK